MLRNNYLEAGALVLASLVVASCSKEPPSTSPLESASFPKVEANPLQGIPRDQLQNHVLNLSLGAFEKIGPYTSLTPFIDSVLDINGPRLHLELTADVAAEAMKFGVKGFKGDAFTLTAQNERGGVTSFSHLMYIQNTAFASTGKLMVILMHELTYMKRREDLVPYKSNAEEEIAVFQLGIGMAEDICRQLEQTPASAPRYTDDKKLAEEIKLALATDRKYLASWLRGR